MKTGICNLPLVPLRAEPSERAEMTSQVLFGDLYEVLEEQPGWLRIRLRSDGYMGWCADKMVQELPAILWKKLSDSRPYITTSVLSHCLSGHGQLLLPAGSRLYDVQPKTGVFTLYSMPGPDIVKEHWTLRKSQDLLQPETGMPYINSPESVNPSMLALRFMQAPYLWGGKTVFGIDCSGLVQVVFSLTGRFLPRDAKDQALKGKRVPRLADARPGDLAFFTNPGGTVVHVGIVFKDNQLIHASGSVHIDKLDQSGIYSVSQATYTHQLAQIRRI